MYDYMDELHMADADWIQVDMYIEEHQFDKQREREKKEKQEEEKQEEEKQEADKNNELFRKTNMKETEDPPTDQVRGVNLCFDCRKSLTKNSSWTLGNTNYCLDCVRHHLAP